MKNNKSMALLYQIIFLVAFVANICAAQEAVEQHLEQPPISLEMLARWAITDGPDDVYIRVSEALDEWRYYCLDIPGNSDELAGVRLSVHTCKEGMQHRDMIFSNERTANGDLYMTDYDLCIEANTQEVGSFIQLAKCTGNSPQKWDFSDENIRPMTNSDLCLTVSPDPGELTSGGVRYPTRYIANSISLQTCNDEATDRQQWLRAKPRLDLKAPILPDGSSADWRDWI